MANLTYYIFEGVLIGDAGGKPVHCFAGSGGGAGAKVAKPTAVANNPYATGVKQPAAGQKDQAYGQTRGGPLPPGHYKILPPAQHPKLGRSAKLQPSGPLVNNRGGFYIHGRGPHGSDGCLVLERTDLNPLLDQIARDKGGTLFCLEAMGGDRFA